MASAPKLLIAAASAAVALVIGLAVAWYAVSQRARHEDTALVDDTEDFWKFLQQRRGERADGEPVETFGPIPEEDAHQVFAGLKSEAVYDPEVYYIRQPGLFAPRVFDEHPGGKWVMRTNSQGFREDRELPESPDARVVVLGDSHTDGVCNNKFSFANQLEELLGERHAGKAIDVVNAGVGSHSFYNYLGAISKYGRELKPDVIVCAVYGGNDFLGVLRPLHYFLREPLPLGGKERFEHLDRFREAVGERADRHMGQAVLQLSYFAFEPEIADEAVGCAIDLTRRMAKRADELGIDLVIAYLPPMWDVQMARYEEFPDMLPRVLGLEEIGAPLGADGWADRWLDATKDCGATFLDLRPSFRDADVDLYWHRDHHVNLDGHRRIAELLVPIVDPLLEL